MNRLIDIFALCVAGAFLFLALVAFNSMGKHPVLGAITGGSASLLGLGALALTYRR
jgi:hypothetical protein